MGIARGNEKLDGLVWNKEKLGGVAWGSEVVWRNRSQTIDLLASWWARTIDRNGLSGFRWTVTTTKGIPIKAILTDGNDRDFRTLGFNPTTQGTVQLNFEPAFPVMADLSNEFETNGTVIIENSEAGTLVVKMNSGDTTEPYSWTPSNEAEVRTYRTAMINATDKSATLTIRDY